MGSRSGREGRGRSPGAIGGHEADTKEPEGDERVGPGMEQAPGRACTGVQRVKGGVGARVMGKGGVGTKGGRAGAGARGSGQGEGHGGRGDRDGGETGGGCVEGAEGGLHEGSREEGQVPWGWEGGSNGGRGVAGVGLAQAEGEGLGRGKGRLGRWRTPRHSRCHQVREPLPTSPPSAAEVPAAPHLPPLLPLPMSPPPAPHCVPPHPQPTARHPEDEMR